MTSILDILKMQMGSTTVMGGLSVEGILIAMALSAISGFVIFQVYRVAYSGVVYINHFAITLVSLTMITCLMILTITSNLLLSLGMVGALSIVRFRAAVKEPLDIIYMFWAIATGIAVGAGFFTMAALGLISIGAVMWLFTKWTVDTSLYLLIIQFKKDFDRVEIESAIRKHAQSSRFRSEIALEAHRELTMEIRLKKHSTGLLSVIESVPGVINASMIGVNSNQMH